MSAKSIASARIIVYSTGGSHNDHHSMKKSSDILGNKHNPPLGSFFSYHKTHLEGKAVSKTLKSIAQNQGCPHHSDISIITKMNLKSAENLLLRNNPSGFHWNTRNSVSTLGDACGGQNGFTLILKDGHIISYSLGLHGKLENVRISTFLHQQGFSDISHAQIFENILIFTEGHTSQISIFSWNGRWKQATVGSVDIIEAISLLYHSPQVHYIDVGLMDLKFCIHEKKPILFVYNNLALKIFKLVSKASQSISLVELQTVPAQSGIIKFLFQKVDRLNFVEIVKPDDSFGSVTMKFRSFKVSDSGATSTDSGKDNDATCFRFDANVTHCNALDDTFNQYIICCSDCTVHVIDISIGKIMRSINVPSNAETVSHHPHSSLTAIVMGNGDLIFLDRGLNLIPISLGLIEANSYSNVPVGQWLSRSSLGGGRPTIMRWGRLMESSDSSSLFICYEMGQSVMIKLEYSYFMGNLKTCSLLSHYIETHDLAKAFNIISTMHGLNSVKSLQIMSSYVFKESEIEVMKKFLELVKLKYTGCARDKIHGPFFQSQLQEVSRRHVLKLIRMGHEDLGYHFIRNLDLFDLLFPLMTTSNDILRKLVLRDLRKWTDSQDGPVMSNFKSIVFPEKDVELQELVKKVMMTVDPDIKARKHNLVDAIRYELDLNFDQASAIYLNCSKGPSAKREIHGINQIRSLQFS